MAKAAGDGRRTVFNAASSNDPRRLLVALRNQIAAAIDEGVPPRDLASLSKRLVDINNEIRALDERDSAKENPIVQAFGIRDLPLSDPGGQ
ncbi:hypothetical protein [Bifidobacterium samirii]|uniref:Uncharacterized protein n=1 Tax=Bifidobacterium samirii TaxID=2306974 RepID=A0A430FJF0_9BIFI|nr:hypothetical protein [Bifidobacterium samirii]RSX53015.1 hypothetical protein D2E24_1686 [Bifidobacterium samirii]